VRLFHFSDDPAIGFKRVDQGNGSAGDFAAGTTLLWDINANGNAYSTTGDTIAFGTPVTEAGLQVQADQLNSTKFTAQVFSASSSETFTITTAATGAASLGFLGFRATGGDVITKIVITSTDLANTTFNNDFAIGPVTFGSDVAAVPEPSTFMMAGLGVAAFVAYRRRRLARKAE